MSYIESAGSNIYFSREKREGLPQEVSINGTKYYRIMDFIYIPGPSYELTNSQVQVVSMLRDKYDPQVAIEGTNRAVRRLFRELVLALEPKSVLELGPGLAPLYSEKEAFFTYNLLDVRRDTVNRLRHRGLPCQLLSLKRTIKLRPGSQELVVALFVLHFPFHEWEAKAIESVLSCGGVFVANVYRRGPDARRALKTTFSKAGLEVEEFLTQRHLCREHRYWVMSRDSRGDYFERTKQALLREIADV